MKFTIKVDAHDYPPRSPERTWHDQTSEQVRSFLRDCLFSNQKCKEVVRRTILEGAYDGVYTMGSTVGSFKITKEIPA